MHEVRDWFKHQSARERRSVYLEEAFLGNRVWAYAAYRLRYFFARYAASSIVHATTVVLLSRTFGRSDFVVVLVAYAAAGLLGSFWWGALEVMRSRVRLLHRSGKPYLIPREIGGWLSLSIWLAAAVCAAGVFWAVARTVSGGALNAADVYVLAILFRLAAELVTRCYHSGIYAIRRVFRPLPAILAVDAVSLAGVLLLWPWLGGWAFGVAAVVATTTITGLTFHYTGRLYRFYGFAPMESLDFRRPRVPRGDQGRELLAAGFSSALMSLDAVLVLVALRAGQGPLGSSTLFILFFAIAPTIRAVSEWAQLLYFDLKRLEIRLFRNLRRTFDRQILRLACVLALIFWVLACLIGTAVVGRSLGDLYWLLLPFFVSYSLLAAVQMQAFSERAYRLVLENGAFCTLGFVAAALLLGGQQALLLAALSAVAFAATAVMHARRPELESALRSREVLWLSEWLAELRDVRGPVRVASVRLWDPPGAPDPREENGWRRRQLAEQVARRLKPPSGVTLLDGSVVAWYEPAHAGSGVAPEWLLTRTGGLAEWLGETGTQPDGMTALAGACARGLLGRDLRGGTLLARGAVRAEDVRGAFLEAFPRGIVYDPEQPIPEALEALSTADKRLVMLDAAVFARDFRPSNRLSRFDVTAFCVAGELRQIFLVEPTARRRERARWRAAVRQFNLEAALGPAS